MTNLSQQVCLKENLIKGLVQTFKKSVWLVVAYFSIHKIKKYEINMWPNFDGGNYCIL